MNLVGQAVPHRDPGVLCQLLYDLLPIAPVLDAVKHPAQHPGGIRNGLLFSDLAAGRVQIGDLHPQVMRRHLKAAPGAGRGLFKDQGNIFAAQPVMCDAGFFLGF